MGDDNAVESNQPESGQARLLSGQSARTEDDNEPENTASDENEPTGRWLIDLNELEAGKPHWLSGVAREREQSRKARKRAKAD